MIPSTSSVSPRLLALQNDRPGSIDVGHQFVGFLVSAIGVVAFGESEIGRRELCRGQRGDIDPEAFEEGQGVFERQFQLLWVRVSDWLAD